MSGPNGHAHEHAEITSTPLSATDVSTAAAHFSPEKVKEFVAALEVPFDAWLIEWRVMNTTKNGSPQRGQVVPYANQRAYTDRLNALFTPAGWTRKYAIHTSANFERNKDQKIVAKVLVTCELTIFGLASHSATGEEWADNDNAGTSAEAQAFKRACSCVGLGRYLYFFDGVWVDLDERKRPRSIPQLPDWATPSGWARGLRPHSSGESNRSNGEKAHGVSSQRISLIAEIEGMAELLGSGLYRGLLRDVARVWNPRDAQDTALLQRILEHMRAAERGLRRLEAALDRLGHEALVPVLKANHLTSIQRIDNLETLKRVVLELERTPENGL